MSEAARHTLVLDVGKTNVKLLVLSKTGAILEVATTSSQSLNGPPYVHLDTEGVWRWFLAEARTLASKFDIDAIVSTTHGAAVALVDDHGLVLPVLDYEEPIPDPVLEAFEKIRPPFEQTQSPQLPQGVNLGAQLFRLQKDFPDHFGRAQWFLTYPQYLAWCLTGVAASEITSIGCHSHLWEPSRRRFSTLVDHTGWAKRLPPMKPAFEPLGTVLPQIAQQTGLKPDCHVLNGVHDSNACFALYLRGHPEPFSLVSTGTWVVMMSPRLDPAKLQAERDMLAMVNVLGDPLPTAHFMGGREFEVLTGHLLTKDFAEKDVRRVIEKQSFLLPAFAPGGPFMGAEGKRHGPDPTEPGEVLAAASLYLALVTATGLSLLESDGDLIIDGGFVNNPIYCGLLATLCGHERCFLNHQTDGTAIGAGMLAVWPDEKPWPLSLVPVERLDVPGLDEYARDWRQMVG